MPRVPLIPKRLLLLDQRSAMNPLGPSGPLFCASFFARLFSQPGAALADRNGLRRDVVLDIPPVFKPIVSVLWKCHRGALPPWVSDPMPVITNLLK
jgi:hypothetical protein